MPVLLFIWWIILNGRVTLEIVLIGIVVSMITSWFVYGMMNQSFKVEAMVWKRIGKILKYLFVLIIEVYGANLDVIGRVLTDEEQHPSICFFEIPVKTNLGLVCVANSITLTPGTITCTMIGNQFAVHGLDKELLDGIEESGFVVDVLDIEEGL